MADPLRELEAWIGEARARGLAQPSSVAFVTASPEGKPSARTVSLKRVEDDALLFTSALWTRKAREIAANPHVSLLFHWQPLGRQVHVAGTAELTGRATAEELFVEREPIHQLQTLVSRQGETISREELDEMSSEVRRLQEAGEGPRPPADWGGIRVVPEAVEFWTEAPDRMHERRLYTREGDGWTLSYLSP